MAGLSAVLQDGCQLLLPGLGLGDDLGKAGLQLGIDVQRAGGLRGEGSAHISAYGHADGNVSSACTATSRMHEEHMQIRQTPCVTALALLRGRTVKDMCKVGSSLQLATFARTAGLDDRSLHRHLQQGCGLVQRWFQRIQAGLLCDVAVGLHRRRGGACCEGELDRTAALVIPRKRLQQSSSKSFQC